MLFSSLPFLYWFLPIVLIVYFAVPFRLKNAVLLLTSLVFYAWGEPKYVILMITSILLGWGFGLAIGKANGQKAKKVLTGISVACSLSFLLFFKYADFFIANFGAVTGLPVTLLAVALPVGISFYTFQILSYTVDVYRGDAAVQYNVISFGAYVTMFPQLIAGPIVRYTDIAERLDARTHSAEAFCLGLQRFLIGLGKKILLANAFGDLCGAFRAAEVQTVLFHWLYAVSFTMQIYFDFSGYSDMAIGLGRIFGFDFVENFHYPYCSKSITEFWRRWHISLGSWFRDYVYIPLGGNRCKTPRWLFNLAVVWLLTGFWHGAAWNFVLWGVFYGVMLMIEKLWLGKLLEKLPRVVSRLYVLLLVTLGFVLFNAASVAQAGGDIAGMFAFGRLPLFDAEALYYLRSYLVVLAAGIVGCTPLAKTLVGKIEQTNAGARVLAVVRPAALLALLLVCTAYLVDGSFNPFLYFRF